MALILAARSQAAPDPGAAAPANRKMLHLQRFRALFDRSFCTHKPVAFYAGELGITPTQFNRVCRRRLLRQHPVGKGTQSPRHTGAGGSGCPPGPAAKLSGEIASCWPTPGLLQSHTPAGKAACSRARCASVNATGA